MKFGLYIRNKVTYDKMLETSILADKLGYYGVYLNDHIHGFADNGKEPYLDAWTTMTGIGVQTSNIKIGQIVLFNSLRNPAYLAKSVATLDNMTNGRFDLLIGSGWNESEYVSYDLMERGRGMPSAKERVDRLSESVSILKLMLSQEITNFTGEYWQLKDAINIPQPVQSPFRITIGCKGPRMMAIAARQATGINLPTRDISETLTLIGKFKKIHERIAVNEEIRSLNKFDISGFFGMHIARNESELNDMISKLSKSMQVSEKELVDNYMVGTSDMIIDKLRHIEDNGMGMIVLSPTLHSNNTQNPVEYFKDEIISII